jgi:hypothetical protein
MEEVLQHVPHITLGKLTIQRCAESIQTEMEGVAHWHRFIVLLTQWHECLVREFLHIHIIFKTLSITYPSFHLPYMRNHTFEQAMD